MDLLCIQGQLSQASQGYKVRLCLKNQYECLVQTDVFHHDLFMHICNMLCFQSFPAHCGPPYSLPNSTGSSSSPCLSPFFFLCSLKKKKSLYKAPGLYFVIATEHCQVQLPFTITLDNVDAEKLLTLERRRILFISRGARHTRQLASCPPPTAQVSPALCPSLPELPAHLGRVHKHLPSISLPGSFGNQWVACL